MGIETMKLKYDTHTHTHTQYHETLQVLISQYNDMYHLLQIFSWHIQVTPNTTLIKANLVCVCV